MNLRPAEIHALLQHTLEHLALVATAAILGFCIALPLGICIASSRRHASYLATLGIIYTIPSLAMFALLIPLCGLGTPTAIVVLTMYASVFLTRTIALALRALPASIVDHARALGTTRRERLLRIELPLASADIISGLRTTCIMLIATATIAAWIDAGGLGVLLFEGLRQDDMQRIVSGSLAAATLAIGLDGLLAMLERRIRDRLFANK